LQDCLADPCLKELKTGATKDGIAVSILGGNLTKAGAALRKLHSRMHPLMRFYIDGASELEQDDERMGILIAAKMEGTLPIAVLGFLTFFKCVACAVSRMPKEASAASCASQLLSACAQLLCTT
jgi:hypothetical protein